MTPSIRLDPPPRLYALPLPPSLARPPARPRPTPPPFTEAALPTESAAPLAPRPRPPRGRAAFVMLTLLAAMAAQAQPVSTASGAAVRPSETDAFLGSFGNFLGWSAAVSGDLAAVSAAGEDNSIGAVVIYRSDGAAWTAEDTLRAGDGQLSDQFGTSVAVAGDMVVVGARGQSDAGDDAGAVYVFRHRLGTAGGWVEEQTLIASDAEADDGFGYAVAANHRTIVVGTFGAEAVYVFRYDGSAWAEDQVLAGPGSTWFGRAVALSGEHLAVGASIDGEAAPVSGAVHLYRDPGGFAGSGPFGDERKVFAKSPTASGSFGMSVALDGSRLAAGEPGGTVDGLGDAGKVYVYRDLDAASLTTDATLMSPEPQAGAGFGTALAFSDGVLVAGAPFYDGGAITDLGAAHRFTRDGVTGWDDGEDLFASSLWVGMRFGSAVAVGDEGETVWVGAPRHTEAGNNAGAAYVFGTGPAPLVLSSSQAVHDGPGWRLLSAPVAGLTVTDLAALNLVQGVPAGASPEDHPAQYPGAGANLFTEYLGTGLASGYAPPAATDAPLVPGRGFWWYLYDEDIAPPAGGTSQSRELSGFTLDATGLAYEGEVAETFPEAADGFYMIGNPFAAALILRTESPASVPIRTTAGTLGTSFYVWDPSLPGYVVLTSREVGPFDALAWWQGAFAQITGTAGADPTVLYRGGAAGFIIPPFYGRRASEAGLALRLDGTLASGTAVADRAANLRLLDDAEAGWDRHDLSELAPPNAERASLALVGQRDGAGHRQGVLSLPTVLAGEHVVPVAFLASDDGTFEVSWDAAVLPAGWTAALRDRETGTEADLASEGALAFDAQATDWTDRFEIALAASATSGDDGPEAASVGEPYPNPTAGALRLGVALGAAQRVTATVYDALGRQVAVAFDGDLGAGAQTLDLDAQDLAPGLYVVRVTGESIAASRRFIVAR